MHYVNNANISPTKKQGGGRGREEEESSEKDEEGEVEEEGLEEREESGAGVNDRTESLDEEQERYNVLEQQSVVRHWTRHMNAWFALDSSALTIGWDDILDLLFGLARIVIGRYDRGGYFGYNMLQTRSKSSETPSLLRRRLLLRHFPLQLPPPPVRLLVRTFLWRLLSYR